MRRGVLVLAMAAVAGAANAVFLYTGGTLVENFNGLPTTTQTGFFGTTIGLQTLITGSTFEGTKIAGTGTSGMNLIADFGDSNAGGIHSLGAAGNGERALGGLASGTNVPGFGVEVRNMTGGALASMTISFTQETWRNSTSQVNTTAAAWGRTGGGMTATNYITNGSMTAVTALDLVGPPPVTTNGPLDGNAAVNQTARSHTFTFTTPLAAGDSVFLRWQDVDNTGSDADLAIDNFTVSAQAVPEPASLAVLGVGALALLRRRRR